MDSPLSLSVRLTPPPSGSSPDVLATISLSSELQGSTHTGDVLIAPLTEEEEKNIRWYLEEYWLWPYEQFRGSFFLFDQIVRAGLVCLTSLPACFLCSTRSRPEH
jgi:hypothetical protein